MLLVAGTPITKAPVIGCNLSGRLIAKAYHQRCRTGGTVQVIGCNRPRRLWCICRNRGRGLILHADIVDRDITPFGAVPQEDSQSELINTVLNNRCVPYP
jgi:hypothetical protein